MSSLTKASLILCPVIALACTGKKDCGLVGDWRPISGWKKGVEYEMNLDSDTLSIHDLKLMRFDQDNIFTFAKGIDDGKEVEVGTYAIDNLCDSITLNTRKGIQRGKLSFSGNRANIVLTMPKIIKIGLIPINSRTLNEEDLTNMSEVVELTNLHVFPDINSRSIIRLYFKNKTNHDLRDIYLHANYKSKNINYTKKHKIWWIPSNKTIELKLYIDEIVDDDSVSIQFGRK